MKPALRRAELVAAGTEHRLAIEQYITERFSLAYGARVRHFCAELLGMRSTDGAWQAAAGYTPAASRRLFLEQYLDAPVETLLSQASGRQVERSRVAEVGNLAAAAGMGRALIPELGRYLDRLGYRWVVFTATRELRNAFRRLRLEPLELGPALASRLADDGTAWGTYYAHAPLVMGGLIAACLRDRKPACT